MATDKITYDRYKHMGLPPGFAVALAGGTGADDLTATLDGLLTATADLITDLTTRVDDLETQALDFESRIAALEA